MKCLSLFSGIGGFDYALRNKGHEIIGACEIDKYARSIYSRHFPGVRIYEDATKIRPEELPDFELLCAGFPCQAFSIAGKRFGFEESRGKLFFEIARIAKQKRPRIILLENVLGLLNHDKQRTFAQILNTLHEMGYSLEWQVIDSKSFVPQLRERVFIVGYLGDQSRRKIFPLQADYGEASKESKKERQQQNVCCIVANYWKGIDNHGERTMIYMAYPSANMKKRIQVRRETWTMTTLGNDFAVFDQGKFRMLTPLECERLQGFPDNYTKGISDTQRYKCLGNAVTVPVVEYILEKL